MRQFPRNLFFNFVLAQMLVSVTIAQHGDLEGLPVLRNYLPKDYHASGQNWAIAQNHRGVIFVGNTDGLLEYDGVEWRLHTIPNGVVRSLVIDQSGTIFLGGLGEVGYLRSDKKGATRYQSLVPFLPEGDRDFDDVWTLAVTETTLFVHTFSRLFVIPVSRYADTDSIVSGPATVHRPESMFFPGCFVEGRFYVAEKNKGLLEYDGRKLKLVPNGGLFSKDIVYFMLPYSGGTVLVGTLKQGLFLFDGQSFSRFKTEADDYLAKHRLYLPGAVLPDGTYALGTQVGGTVVIDSTGRLLRVINKSSGLKNQTVWYTFVDREKGLWLALDDGIARVMTPFTASVFGESLDLEGRTNSICEYQNRMYVSTGSGVFQLEHSPGRTTPVRFRKVRGINVQAWSFLQTGGSLLVATNDGVASVSGFDATSIAPSFVYAYSLHQSLEDPDVILVGRHGGLARLRSEGASWVEAGIITGITDPLLHLAEGPPGVFWAGSFNRRLLRFTLNSKWDTASVSEIEGMTDLEITGIHADEAGGRILCATDKGLRVIDALSGKVRSPERGQILTDSSINLRAMAFGADTTGWILGTREGKIEIGVLSGRANHWNPSPTSFLLHTLLEGAPSSMSYGLFAGQSAVWVTGGESVVRMSLSMVQSAQTDAGYTLVRQVSHADTIVFSGELQPLRSPTIAGFPAGASLRFDFALTSYIDPQKSEYQYHLDGFDQEWSGWSVDRRKDYTNLPAGSYNFRVRGKRVDEVMGEEAIFPFVILPPWYTTGWALLAYIFLGMLGIWLIVTLRVQVLTMRTKTLEAVVAERTSQVVAQKTQLEQQARRLVELDELKSKFFANVSHEFRTPLTLILGQIDSVLTHVKGTPVQAKLETAARNAKRLHRLINQLLEVSRLESGAVQLNTSRTDLVPLLRNRFFGFESLAEQKKIVMRFEHSHENIIANVDPDKFIEVIDNLLSNALKFTPSDGTIRLSVSAGLPGKITISIADTGIGIPETEVPMIFDRFHQVDASYTREHEGSGLGLSIAREIVLMHNGEITVASTPGKGTEFRIILPTALESESESPPQLLPVSGLPELPEYPATLGTMARAVQMPADREAVAKVLIVEDNTDMQLYIGENLEEGWSALIASNGVEGLDVAVSEIPDLIITDVMMPRMDGIEMSRRLRSDPRTSHIPIVMLTAKATEEGKIEGLEAGVDDYLVKPFSPRELRVRVGNLLKLRKLLRQQFTTVTALDPAKVTEKSLDRQFLENVLSSINRHVEDPQFGVQVLATEAAMSVSQLNRKLNALIDQSAGKLIRSTRMEYAARLLAQNAGTVNDIAYRVGFADHASFTRSFRDHFACSPTEYANRGRE